MEFLCRLVQEVGYFPGKENKAAVLVRVFVREVRLPFIPFVGMCVESAWREADPWCGEEKQRCDITFVSWNTDDECFQCEIRGTDHDHNYENNQRYCEWLAEHDWKMTEEF